MNSKKRTSKVKNGILLAIVIAFLIAIIGGTYANFISTGTVATSATVAKWHVVLGTEDISSTSRTLAVNVEDAETNTNIVEGKIAPGKTVVATFDIDPTGSEVAIDTLIDVKVDEVTGFNDGELSVEKVTYLLNGEGSELETGIDATTGQYFNSESLAHVLANKKVTYKAYIKWNAVDSEERNLTDSTKGANLVNAIIPIQVTVRQYMGNAVAVVQGNTLEDVIANVENGGTVKLQSSMDYTELTNYTGNSYHQVMFPDNATLDLNGKTIKSINGSVLLAGNNLTIKNGTFEGVSDGAGKRT